MRFFSYFTVLFVVILVVFAIALIAIYRDVKLQAIQELNTRQMVHARQASQGIQNQMEYIVSTLDLLARLPDHRHGRRRKEDHERLPVPFTPTR